jgi:hypothetical protein
MKISVEENPAAADLDVIERALVEHNEAKSEPRNHTPLTLFLRSTEGQIVGGLRGHTVLGLAIRFPIMGCRRPAGPGLR